MWASFEVDCSRTFLIHLFVRFAGVSYGWFVAVRFGFNLSTCSEPLVIGRRGCMGRDKWRNSWGQLTHASNPVRKPSHMSVV